MVNNGVSGHKINYIDIFFRNLSEILKGIKITVLAQKLQQFCLKGGFCLLVELHGEGSAPVACAALFLLKYCVIKSAWV